MTRKKYECTYAESRGNIMNEGGGVFCRINSKNCPYVEYVFPFGTEEPGEMSECLAYNIPKDLAKLLITTRFEREKSKLEAKLTK